MISVDKLLVWSSFSEDADRMGAFLGSDPVHMTSAGYRELAKRVVETGLSESLYTIVY